MCLRALAEFQAPNRRKSRQTFKSTTKAWQQVPRAVVGTHPPTEIQTKLIPNLTSSANCTSIWLPTSERQRAPRLPRRMTSTSDRPTLVWATTRSSTNRTTTANYSTITSKALPQVMRETGSRKRCERRSFHSVQSTPFSRFKRPIRMASMQPPS